MKNGRLHITPNKAIINPPTPPAIVSIRIFLLKGRKKKKKKGITKYMLQ